MTRLCGKRVTKAKNGKARGRCTRVFKHRCVCANDTCTSCGVRKTKNNTFLSHVKSGMCKECVHVQCGSLSYRSKRMPGQSYKFRCGCEGILPRLGRSNILAVALGEGKYYCRVSRIIHCSEFASKRKHIVPISKSTPHRIIRKMMASKVCVLCEKPLRWTIGAGQTPHLHHDHETGEILGFAHHRCNPLDLKPVIRRLLEENLRLKNMLENRT